MKKTLEKKLKYVRLHLDKGVPILFALTFGFLLRQSDFKFTYIIDLSMLAIFLTFSIYSAIKTNTQFLGNISNNWPTFVAMYSSILYLSSCLAHLF